LPVYDSAATIGDTTNGGVPNITGNAPVGVYPYGTSGALYVDVGGYNQSGPSASMRNGTIYIDASRSSAVYDSGTTVRPAGVYMNWIIKAF